MMGLQAFEIHCQVENPFEWKSKKPKLTGLEESMLAFTC